MYDILNNNKWKLKDIKMNTTILNGISLILMYSNFITWGSVNLSIEILIIISYKLNGSDRNFEIYNIKVSKLKHDKKIFDFIYK